MNPTLNKLNQQIEALALETVMLDPGDIPGLGKTVMSLESILELSIEVKENALVSIAEAMKQYIEAVILGEKTDLGSFERGVSRLQEICRNIANGKEDTGVAAALLEELRGDDSGTPEASLCSGRIEEEHGSADSRDKDPGEAISEEDMEIIVDFVAESLENLGTIEVRLMDLEQAPGDLEIINAIFRPFHTVKGVSGFLNFKKINKLAHVVENLLDSARDGKLNIDAEVVDIILDSVDLLKRMIENVRDSLDCGKLFEGDEDTEELTQRIEQLISSTQNEGKKRLGEMLVAKGVVTATDVEDALEIQQQGNDKKIGEILVEQEKVSTRAIVSTLRDQKRIGGPVLLQVKVDTLKLDNIVDMVGELAIAQSMLRQHEVIQASGDRKLYQITSQLNLITSGLQNTAMSLRMVPIKHTFQKMLRLVRDLAKKAGKEIQLVMLGEDTEMDRNMVEEIYEPMVHMIRNSVDHGLERPDERKAKNKPGRGTIFLKAYHKGGNIVIEIEDDGRGLNREKILKKAVSRELVKPEDKLTEAEIDNLIFLPGFSTADEVTDISGRGVGTDIVKNKVEKLRGRVEVQSVTEKGTTFFIRLPLTLAIVNGMIVRIGEDRYIIPTLSVQESFRPGQKECSTVKGDGEMIKVRNNLIPLIRMDRLLKQNGNGSGSSSQTRVPPWEKLVVVVEYQEEKRCLLVDELIGQEEVVIKNLGGWLKDIKGIAGSVIMGDGKVGLILDIGGIFQIV